MGMLMRTNKIDIIVKNHGIDSIIVQLLSSPSARNRRVRPGEGGV